MVQESSQEMLVPFGVDKSENRQTRGTAKCKLNKRNIKGRVSRCFIFMSKFRLSRSCSCKQRKLIHNGEHTAPYEVSHDEENLNISISLDVLMALQNLRSLICW